MPPPGEAPWKGAINVAPGIARGLGSNKNYAL